MFLRSISITLVVVIITRAIRSSLPLFFTHLPTSATQLPATLKSCSRCLGVPRALLARTIFLLAVVADLEQESQLHMSRMEATMLLRLPQVCQITINEAAAQNDVSDSVLLIITRYKTDLASSGARRSWRKAPKEEKSLG